MFQTSRIDDQVTLAKLALLALVIPKNALHLCCGTVRAAASSLHTHKINDTSGKLPQQKLLRSPVNLAPNLAAFLKRPAIRNLSLLDAIPVPRTMEFDFQGYDWNGDW